jgi:hypothetical protein
MRLPAKRPCGGMARHHVGRPQARGLRLGRTPASSSNTEGKDIRFMDSILKSMLCVLLVVLSVIYAAIKLRTKFVHRSENFFLNH